MGRLAALFDSNILIDYFDGVPAAGREVRLFRERAISLITWIEVMVGVQPEHETRVRSFLKNRFNIIPITDDIAERAVLLRRKHRLKLPDALILATAEVQDYLLLTRDIRDFPQPHTHVHFPYQISSPGQ